MGTYRRTGLAAFAAMSCLAWGLPVSAQASSSPVIESEAVSHITPTDATLEAQINPESLERGAHYQFQLVANPSEYLQDFACPTEGFPANSSLCVGGLASEAGALPIGTTGTGVQGETVSLDLSAPRAWWSGTTTLKPGSTYHYRVIAARSVQTVDTISWEDPIVYGPDQTFTTPPPAANPPVIESEAVSHITPTDATLEAQINPEGLETTYEVWVGALPCVEEAGPEACEEDKVAGTIHAGFSAQTVSVDIAKASHKLKPNSLYLYSFRATNLGGTTYASNKEFKTGAASPPSIESESLSHLTSTDATLEARINTEGLETTYEFHLVGAYCEWPCESPEYLFTLPSGKLLGSFVGQSVSLDLNSADVRLMPVNTYWVTATNAAGTTVGSSHTFRSGEEGVQPLSTSTTTSTSSGAGQPAGINTNTNTGNQPAGSAGSSSSSTLGVQSPGHQVGKTIKREPLTSAQKLAKALKACKNKPKGKQAACKKQAHKKYATTASHTNKE
jgi:hypothetical protein